MKTEYFKRKWQYKMSNKCTSATASAASTKNKWKRIGLLDEFMRVVVYTLVERATRYKIKTKWLKYTRKRGKNV